MTENKLAEEKAKTYDLIVQREILQRQEQQLSQSIAQQVQKIVKLEEESRHDRNRNNKRHSCKNPSVENK